MTLKTIKIDKDTREILREMQSDGESVDMTIRKLFDVVNDRMQDTVWVTGKTNINISEETAMMVKEYRINEFESYDSILRRAISLYLDMK